MAGSQLVDADDVLQHLDDPEWRIIDCRFDLGSPQAGRASYLEGHIPGAVYADLNDDLAARPTPGTGRHPLPAVDDIAAAFGRLGIATQTQVVVYDAGNGAMAARCWWLLRWLGHERVALLDGGLDHWQACALPLTAGSETAPAKTFAAQARDEFVIATAELASGAADIAAMNLLDARDPARFRGEAEPIDAVAGHIPGARNQPFSTSLKADGSWKSPDTLRSQLAQQLGADLSVPWAVMCGSGVTACHLALAGVQAGYSLPRLYVGSWSEWIRDSARPVGLGSD